MKNRYAGYLAGQIGEALVVAELGRRGIVATSFSGNIPDIDILAHRERQTTPVQVKSWSHGSVGLTATKYINIIQDGDRQKVQDVRDDLNEALVYVFVNLSNFAGQDRFFILPQTQLGLIIAKHYSCDLERHGGIRPKNAQSKHTSVLLRDLEAHEDKWDVIECRLQ